MAATQYYTVGVGTPIYMPPVSASTFHLLLFRNSCHEGNTTKVRIASGFSFVLLSYDSSSFAVVAWQILTGKEPYAGMAGMDTMWSENVFQFFYDPRRDC